MAGFEGWEFHTEEFDRQIVDLGRAVVPIINVRMIADMVRAAPKDSGAGAKSIHAEEFIDEHGYPASRIGPDSAHFYMVFHEFGTEKMPAHPFMRPAAKKRRRLQLGELTNGNSSD